LAFPDCRQSFRQSGIRFPRAHAVHARIWEMPFTSNDCPTGPSLVALSEPLALIARRPRRWIRRSVRGIGSLRRWWRLIRLRFSVGGRSRPRIGRGRSRRWSRRTRSWRSCTRCGGGRTGCRRRGPWRRSCSRVLRIGCAGSRRRSRVLTGRRNRPGGWSGMASCLRSNRGNHNRHFSGVIVV